MDKTVLLVEDAALMRNAVQKALTAARYTVTACENGRQALELLTDREVDALVLDLEMPVLDGLSLLRRIRPRTRAQIVVLSSTTTPGSAKAKEARRLGADAVLEKPRGSVSPTLGEHANALVETLRHLLP